MILIDALYINNSGGKVLLDYLMEAVEASAIETTYLLDERVRDNHPAISKNKIIYLKAGITARYKFYKKHKNDFSTILCFGNLGLP
ncbi:hypothetical protein [Flavobacterium sp. 3HN19-14]|uniref:hypothetical protein n=1 Tax=Flavobacterium sp. 3HN19-14 TaxID=3448133 RepID=UPI003EE290B0